MDYEMMVKEAYEEIVGFEKEAAGLRKLERMGVESSDPRYKYKLEQAAKRDGYNLNAKSFKDLGGPSNEEYARRIISAKDSQQRRQIHSETQSWAAKQKNAQNKRILENTNNNIRNHNNNVLNNMGSNDRVIQSPNGNGGIVIKSPTPSSTSAAQPTAGNTKSGFRPTGKQVGIAAGATAGTALALYGAKKLYDRHKAKQAEKAAAYYDEAQLVKEAAEYDYAEACAYEEAALRILDELGYID